MLFAEGVLHEAEVVESALFSDEDFEGNRAVG